MTVEFSGDMGAFISKKMVGGLGLTTTEQTLARASPIKYAGKRDKPARLIDTMVRFGVDILTMTLITQEQLLVLRETSSSHWSRLIASASDSEDTESSSDDSQISVGWDARDEIETLPVQGTDEHPTTVTRHVNNLVQCYVSM